MIRQSKILVILAVLFFFSARFSYSQVIAPVGEPSHASSQLVYWYDEYGDNGPSHLQVTNTNDTEGVWIHVQIFRNYDATDPIGDGNGVVNCDERDFIDFLTPNDTHVYHFGDSPFNKNEGEAETNLGEEVNIDLADTKGFAIITPVVSEADLSAISFQHLIGNINVEGMATTLNAMGRDAVDFTTGEVVPEGTVLDGVTNGYIVLQPEELLFNFYCSGSGTEVVGITFQDNYGPAGLLGYQVTPANVNWAPFIFDFKEDPTSCGNRTIACFDDMGLDETDFTQFNTLLGEDFLCSGFNPPDGNLGDVYGWTRVFVSGYGDYVNHLGIWGNDCHDGADWMMTRGEVSGITPPPTEEICDDEAMADEDGNGFANCLDPACATAANCETGAEECADTVDNDSDGKIDCLDEGCDGFAGCEFGTETSCDDGIDNDADGQTDCNDTDCAATEACGGGTTGGGGGGGCVVAGSVSAATAANCETGAEECADTVDNDSDGKVDCLDEGCDGFAGCEFGTEVSCDDGIDNDADGQTDCNDTDCAAAEACGGGTTGGGGGGGCSVATSVTTATAAANMLLPLLPLFGAYGIRRKIRK